jgi:phosphopantothenoylcysteine decarboxylase
VNAVRAVDAAAGQRRLLVGACGAANVMNLPGYLLALCQIPEVRVQVVMTAAAARFLPARTVRLVSEAVFCEGESNFDPGHAKLATWADHVIVLPATADVLAQVAHGCAGDLLTATLLAYQGHATFFPSMNEAMWRKPAVQRNVAQLKADGYLIAGPVMAQSWEIAGNRMKVAAGLPPPSRVAEIIRDIILPADVEDQVG